MKTQATLVTARGQVSIPADVRRKMNLTSGRRLVWDPVSESECRVRVAPAPRRAGAMAMLGHAATFRKIRPTRDWMKDLREGERA